jgi:aldehyde dehydrogenase (NAD+)
LVARIIAHCRMPVPGATWEKRAILPPIVSQRQAIRIDGIVNTSLAEGAEALLGGDWESAASHYRPTVLGGVTNATTAVREEIFGPVLTVQSFNDEEEAWALAAHGTYGLATGIHTGDVSRALRAVRKLEAGTVWVNRYGRSEDFVIPTGGFKSSGEKAGLVIKGTFRISVDNTETLIEEGDSFQFDSELPHWVKNERDEVSVLMWIMVRSNPLHQI